MDGGIHEVDKKAKAKTAHLNKRKEERIENVRMKKDEDQDRISKLETNQHFSENFTRERDSLRQKLDDSNITVKSDRADVANYLQELTESHDKLTKFLNDSTVFLRPYQLEQAQKSMIELQMQIMKKNETLQPRKKFAFKSKKNVVEVSKDVPSTVSKSKTASGLTSTLSQCQVSAREGETVNLTGPEINGNDISLCKLRHCVLILKGYPGTVHVSDVDHCTILCGPVSGSVFIEKCTSSRIVTGCQQLRVHEALDTDFYLHVTSRAIIEDSKSLRFAPYNWAYEGYEADLVSSKLKSGINNWDKVDDFCWLSKEKSPNWTIMLESAREKSWLQ